MNRHRVFLTAYDQVDAERRRTNWQFVFVAVAFFLGGLWLGWVIR